MPNVKATADISVWNKYEDRNRGYSKVNEPGPDGMYKCHHRHNCDTDTYNGQKQLLLFSTGRQGAGRFHCGKQGTHDKWRSYCITPNSGKSRLSENEENFGKPCLHASSASWKSDQVGKHIEGEKKQTCTYDSLSSANLVEFSKDEKYNKHSRQGKDGQTLYQQLVKQYCQDYRNLFEVVEGNDNKTCLQLSNNPHSSKTLGEDLAHLKDMITESQKQQFCNENPSYEWCGLWNLLKKDGDRMFCEKDVNKDYPGCKEYRRRLDTIYEKNKDQYNVVQEVGKKLPHCTVPEVWATDKDIYIPSNKVNVLKSCPSNVTCIIANNFADANMQNTNFNNNATCDTDVNSSVTLVDGAGDSEASESFTNTYTQASPSGGGSYSGSNNGSSSSSSSSSRSTSPPEEEKTNWLVIILAIVSMFGCMFASIALATFLLSGDGGGGGGGGDGVG